MLGIRYLCLIYILATWILLIPLTNLNTLATKQEACIVLSGDNGSLIKECLQNGYTWSYVMSTAALSLFIHNIVFTVLFLATSKQCTRVIRQN
jgi:hypothetical protein